MSNPSRREVEKQLDIYLKNKFGAHTQVNKWLFRVLLISTSSFVATIAYDCIMMLDDRHHDVFFWTGTKEDFGRSYVYHEADKPLLFVVAFGYFVLYALFFLVYGLVQMNNVFKRYLLYRKGYTNVSGSWFTERAHQAEPNVSLFSDDDLPKDRWSYYFIDVACFVLFLYISKLMHIALWECIHNIYILVTPKNQNDVLMALTKMIYTSVTIWIGSAWLLTIFFFFTVMHFRQILYVDTVTFLSRWCSGPRFFHLIVVCLICVVCFVCYYFIKFIQ